MQLRSMTALENASERARAAYVFECCEAARGSGGADSEREAACQVGGACGGTAYLLRNIDSMTFTLV